MRRIRVVKKNKFAKVIDLLITLIFGILTILLIINIIKLSNIENLIRIIVIVFSILIFIGMIVLKKKKSNLIKIIMIILSLGYIFLNYTFYKIYSSLDNITVQVNTKVLCLVTSSNNIKKLEEMTKEEIAILSSNNDSEFYDLAENILTEKGLENRLTEYDGYIEIINALLNNEIKYAFLPENYEAIYNASKEEPVDLKFNTLYKETKTTKIEENIQKQKSITEPFSILLIGTDVILDSYNADTLMLLTINPKTLKVTMLSIPRDTYTAICTGGKHKINSSGWYGDKCVVKTLENYLDIDIDYYAKINFFGVVELVNKLGGVDVNVPYAFCEQNSTREFGDKMVYVDAGEQTLNGEQALSLSRNRHYWEGLCPKKYTTDGNRSDITRGQNQQLVIKAIINKIMTTRSIDTFYGILDTVSQNMTTNMSKDTILSFYNIGKDILKRLNKTSTDELINIERLSFRSEFATVHISGLDLSMIVNYKESIKYVSDQMKKNLGLQKKDQVTNFSFDINENYETEEIEYESLTINLKTLPNFIGKTIKEANNYCNNNNLKCQIPESTLTKTVTSQSIPANTDISTIKNKTIIFEVINTKLEEQDNTIDEQEKEESIKDDKEQNTEKEETNNTTEEPTPEVEDLPKEEEKEETNNTTEEPPKEEIEDKEDLNEEET